MSNTTINHETCPTLATLDLIDSASEHAPISLQWIHMTTQALRTHESLLSS